MFSFFKRKKKFETTKFVSTTSTSPIHQSHNNQVLTLNTELAESDAHNQLSSNYNTTNDIVSSVISAVVIDEIINDSMTNYDTDTTWTDTSQDSFSGGGGDSGGGGASSDW